MKKESIKNRILTGHIEEKRNKKKHVNIFNKYGGKCITMKCNKRKSTTAIIKKQEAVESHDSLERERQTAI